MKHSDGLKKRRLFPAVASCCCLLFVLFSMTVFAADGLSMSVTYGYRNTAKNGQMLPVTIEFRSPYEETFSGYVVIEAGEGDDTLSYTYPVEIPAGGSAEKFTITVPKGLSEGERDVLRVSILDETGESIIRETVHVAYHGNGNDVLIGILSENLESLLYFGNAALPGNMTTKTVTLNPADLPEAAVGLSQLDMIVISSFDVGRLSEESVQAISEWTQSGGTLLFGAGSRNFSLGAFEKILGDVSFSAGRYEEMDMGMEYSESGPDGAMQRLYIRPVFWEGSARLFDHGDIALCQYEEMGGGRICFAVCDLCSLSGFCVEHPAFTEDFLAALFGERGISDRKKTEDAGSMTNTYTRKRIPSLFAYVMIGIFYVIFCGPGLYHVLRSKGLGIFYMPGTVMLSAAFVLVIFIASQKTRVEEPYVDYGAIIRVGETENEAELETVVRIGSPARRPVTLELPGNLTVKPVEVHGDLSVTGGKTRTLALTGQQPFEENIIALSGRAAAPDEGDLLKTDIRRKGISYTGSIVNTSELCLENAILIGFGEAVFLGDLHPGTEAYLEACPRYYGPAEEILKAYFAAVSGEYPVQSRALLKEALQEISLTGPSEAWILSFADAYIPAFLEESRLNPRGTTLFCFSEPVSESAEEAAYVNVLYDPVTVVSGVYDTERNTIRPSASTVLTYSLGNGYEIEGMRFVRISGELEGSELRDFSGQMSLYNYGNGGYDLLDAGTELFGKEELLSYLSPANNMTVRFMPDPDGGDGLEMALPVPYVVRKASSKASGQDMNPEE